MNGDRKAKEERKKAEVWKRIREERKLGTNAGALDYCHAPSATAALSPPSPKTPILKIRAKKKKKNQFPTQNFRMVINH
jgi:hypothetical protein